MQELSSESSTSSNENIEPVEAPIQDAPIEQAQHAEPMESAAPVEPEPMQQPSGGVPNITESESLGGATIGVRFPTSSKLYCFRDPGLGLKVGDQVIVESELGVSLSSVSKAPFECPTERDIKTVLRRATAEDIRQVAENEAFCLEARVFCNERIVSRALPMKLLMAEVTLDRKRLLFYFISETRIDFRDLVKDLAAKFRTRIELRQIGVRDAAKMVGGIGVCGLEYCCRTFLRSFAPISIKMAKQQDLVLNTCKLSGGCGRLLCCLNYEYDENAAKVKKRPKMQQPPPPVEQPTVAAEAGQRPARPQPPRRPTRPQRPAPPPPQPGDEPSLTYKADFEYEPEFAAPDKAADAKPSTGEAGGEDKQRRRRRRGRKKPTSEGGASQPQAASAQPREPRPQQQPRLAEAAPQREGAPAEGASSGEGGGDAAQRARRKRRWRGKPKGGGGGAAPTQG